MVGGRSKQLLDFSPSALFGIQSVSLSFTLCRNKKDEQHIRKNIHKSIVLRFWVEGVVNFLCGLGSQVSLL